MIRLGTLFSLALGLFLAAGAAAQVNPEHVARIREAAPQAAPARPAQPRKVLVYSRCTGFRHGSIPYFVEAIKILGEQTGAFEAVVSDDLRNFEADRLRQFDAVFLNNTTGELFLPHASMPEDQNELAREHGQTYRENLLRFVASGKGLVGAHAATDCSYQWHEYGRMIGGYFNRHPWNESVAVKLDEPAHPLNAAFGGEGFRVHDEIYQFREPYSRTRQRVLLSLDMENTRDRGQREDNDYPISWVKPYGRGRVFYCSLGHRVEVLMDPAILAHFLAGIQFAIGDLPADMTPSRNDEPGFVPLFNGRDLAGWTQDKSPEEGWHVDADGHIAWRRGAGFLWSERTYQDFVLRLEFRVSPRANSGVFVRTASKPDWLNTGIEVQVLDSAGRENPNKHDSGAIYDIMPPARNMMRPAGEWNDLIITARGSRVQVEMNGGQIIDIDLSQWTEARRNPDGSGNKFRLPYRDLVWPGYLAFQDHGQPVWYRNVRIKDLSPPPSADEAQE